MILNDEQLAHRKLSCVTDSQRDFLDTIANLKRQLQQALAQVEIVDRSLGDPGNASSKAALDAYVQEKVDRARQEMVHLFDDEYCKHNDPLLGIIRTRKALGELAANRAKVATPADPPKEKP